MAGPASARPCCRSGLANDAPLSRAELQMEPSLPLMSRGCVASDSCRLRCLACPCCPEHLQRQRIAGSIRAMGVPDTGPSPQRVGTSREEGRACSGSVRRTGRACRATWASPGWTPCCGGSPPCQGRAGRGPPAGSRGQGSELGRTRRLCPAITVCIEFSLPGLGRDRSSCRLWGLGFRSAGSDSDLPSCMLRRGRESFIPGSCSVDWVRRDVRWLQPAMQPAGLRRSAGTAQAPLPGRQPGVAAGQQVEAASVRQSCPVCLSHQGPRLAQHLHDCK